MFGRQAAALELEPVKGMRARTRGQKQHPGRKPYGLKRTRKMSLPEEQSLLTEIEDSITVAPVLDGPVRLPGTPFRGTDIMPLGR